jgi:hypothetical protein
MKHYLKNKSSFIVVVLKSLRHGACVNCGAKISSLEESEKHWTLKLKQEERNHEGIQSKRVQQEAEKSI